jgi:hypothetical protein
MVNKEAMVDIVQKFKIHMLNPHIGHSKEIGYTIEVITTTDEIPLLAKNGYNIQILEEVGLRNCYRQQQQQSLPSIDFSSACLDDPMTS